MACMMVASTCCAGLLQAWVIASTPRACKSMEERLISIDQPFMALACMYHRWAMHMVPCICARVRERTGRPTNRTAVDDGDGHGGACLVDLQDSNWRTTWWALGACSEISQRPLTMATACMSEPRARRCRCNRYKFISLPSLMNSKSENPICILWKNISRWI